MNEPTSTTGHVNRYAGHSGPDLDTALTWLANQGAAPWLARVKYEGDWVRVDTRGMPPLIRQLVREQFDALELMTATQVRQLVAGTLKDRVQLVDQVLTEHGR